MSDRIAVINHGRVMQLDTPRAIYEHPANRFVAEFIGESSFLKVEFADGAYRCAGQPLLLSAPAPAGGPRLLMLRPERVRIVTEAARDGCNVLAARVTDVIYQGDTYLVQATLADGGRITARGIAESSAMAEVPPVGGEVRLCIRAEDTVLIADTNA
jgi:putative spermidine/putrescine transport system ATP-binding protein